MNHCFDNENRMQVPNNISKEKGFLLFRCVWYVSLSVNVKHKQEV